MIYHNYFYKFKYCGIKLYIYWIFQHLHNKLMEDFGLPTWGSYLIFALATIVMGAILGLVSLMVYFIFNFS